MNENILIVTDSLSSILAIQNFDNRHRLVNSVIKYVDKLDMNNCKIYLEWVKSHSGNALNDKVDLLAKQAVSINYSKTFSRVPIDFIKSQIGIEARKEYHQWYSSLDNNLRIKTLFPKLRDLTNFIGSYEIGFIESQVITGHGHLKEYLHRRHVTVDPYCECDSVSIQNADHLLFACSTYRSISSPLINKLNRYKIPLAVQQVIKTKLAGLLFKTFRKIYEEMLQLQMTDSLSSILAIQNFDNRHRLVNSVIKYVDKVILKSIFAMRTTILFFVLFAAMMIQEIESKDNKKITSKDDDGQHAYGTSSRLTSYKEQQQNSTSRIQKKEWRRNEHSKRIVSKRSAEKLPPHFEIKDICKRHELEINFEKIKFDWIIMPKSYKAYYCKGSCSYPITSTNITKHATIQSIVHLNKPGNEVPEPCCVPNILSPLQVFTANGDGKVAMKYIDDMIVESCGCK
ncbi:Bone morphogenetic protein 8A [Nymphon striatum]|nr:Bone morphogenetic protein 8A [Nymphon striatum]